VLKTSIDLIRFSLKSILTLKDVYYAVGYCGHGVAIATNFGEKLADMILGNGSPTIFSVKMFKTMPFYSGNPWFLPLVHLYFKVLDRLPYPKYWRCSYL